MRSRTFLSRYSWAIIAVFTALAILLALLFLHEDGARNIDDQINDLYSKAELVEQDFSNVYQLSNTICYINENDKVVVFNQENCLLKVKYNRDGLLLTKEFQDSRIGSNLFVVVIVAAGFGVIAFAVSGFSVAMLDIVLEKKEKRKLATKEQDDSAIGGKKQ